VYLKSVSWALENISYLRQVGWELHNFFFAPTWVTTPAVVSHTG
jgi:hypothetical protein